MTLKLASLFRTNNESRIMGISVIRGAMDTFIPAFMVCLRVSDITSTRSGPGVNPAARPKRIPALKNSNIFLPIADCLHNFSDIDTFAFCRAGVQLVFMHTVPRALFCV